MSIDGQTFIQKFETYCPLWLAEEGDPVGLHIGTLAKPIQRIMMTLDVRPEVVEEAIKKGVDLIVAKHPPIFRPIQRLVPSDLQTKMYIDLVKHDIAVYAAHTNMDIIWDGLNDWFCEQLDIEVQDYLKETHRVQWKKLVVYVPTDAAADVRKALAKAGAGQQGNYQATSFSSVGVGRFTPLDGANPVIGERNQAQEVKEERVEVLYLETLEADILLAMKEAHPYEKVAYDILSLGNPPKTYGIGRVGQLKKPMKTEEFVQKVKQTFQLDGLRLIQPTPAKEVIQIVAICGGTGGNLYTDALRKHADVYITGDVYYHTAHDMQTNGLTVIDPGHHIEVLCISKFVEKMLQWKKELDWDVDIIPSEVNTNPFEFR